MLGNGLLPKSYYRLTTRLKTGLNQMFYFVLHSEIIKNNKLVKQNV